MAEKEKKEPSATAPVKLATNIGQSDIDRLGLDYDVEECTEGAVIEVNPTAAAAMIKRGWALAAKK